MVIERTFKQLSQKWKELGKLYYNAIFICISWYNKIAKVWWKMLMSAELMGCITWFTIFRSCLGKIKPWNYNMNVRIIVPWLVSPLGAMWNKFYVVEGGRVQPIHEGLGPPASLNKSKSKNFNETTKILRFFSQHCHYNKTSGCNSWICISKNSWSFQARYK